MAHGESDSASTSSRADETRREPSVAPAAYDEAALVGRLRRGDAGAFDAVVAAFRSRLYAFLVRLTRDRTLAEDLLQETWLRLARHAATLTPDTRLGPWLFRVARNLFVSHRRFLLVDRERIDELARFVGIEREPITPYDVAVTRETQRRLERALASLPLRLREVALLVLVEHMPHRDAAVVLGLSDDALRQRLARAREALAAHLDRKDTP